MVFVSRIEPAEVLKWPRAALVLGTEAPVLLWEEAPRRSPSETGTTTR